MKYRIPEAGSENVYKNKFLWLPLEINGESRWLEKASWKERCYHYRHPSLVFGSFWYSPIEWIDEDETIENKSEL